MAIVNLISTKTLKDEYLIDDNLDEKYYISLIKKCQDCLIKPLLGGDKYNEIINQVTSTTLTFDNETLIDDYIQPIIGYYVMSEVVYSTAYKLKNQGIETGDQNRFNELVKVSEKYRKDCNEYQQILKDYVCDKSIQILPEKNTINYGIYLGKTYYKDYHNQPDKNKQ